MGDLPGLSRDYLFKLGKAVLSAVYAYWPADAPPLPKRSFVSNGTVFFETEVLAVSFGRGYAVDGDVTSEQWNQQEQLQRRAQIIEVSLARKVPDIGSGNLHAKMPTIDQQEQSAVEVYGDAMDVWKCVRAAWRAQQLLTVDALAFQDWNPIGPEGGIGGGVTQMRALLQ